MATYRMTQPYRAMGTRLFQPGEVLSDSALGGRGEHLVNIGRAVRLSAPAEPDDEPVDDIEPDGDIDLDDTVDLNAIAAVGIPNFDNMNKTQIVEWAEANNIKINKRDRVDDIISTIMAAVG